ncbi:NAD(P)-dependent oxidoreductase [Nitratireductor kimnyeongensis]|uniref:NAD(P)-dependent oxidoreductase n=1 Tax=Nitratireductor kimnyeongensis TaxID=430679 RepID=A0ABW0TCA3_9HYPH|nr:NAD(P)-dependent oxidoreductase [Nitratireductor kimnyeongensis]QZZ36775.1 hydroxyacid dehydrogenase [Nitratireductor kimnyeongensis]
MAEQQVLLTNPIHPDGEAILRDVATLVVAPDTNPETLRRMASEADGIIVRAKLPDDILDHAPRLKGMVRHGVGLDFIPVSSATRLGVAVANLPGSNTNAVAEFVFASLLRLKRDHARFDTTLRASGWDEARALANNTEEISSGTMGIVGVGAIGSRIAHIASNGFGMRVIGSSRRKGNMPQFVEEVDLDRLFSEADVVVLSCALTEDTRGLADVRRISSMKPTSVLINVSRGAVVETQALMDALHENRIAGAALDVFERQPLPDNDPLLGCPNLVLSPHVAAITGTSMRAMSVGAAEEMRRILLGEPPVNLVNPESRDAQKNAARGDK